MPRIERDSETRPHPTDKDIRLRTIVPLRAGVRYFGDGESWQAWAVFDAHNLPEPPEWYADNRDGRLGHLIGTLMDRAARWYGMHFPTPHHHGPGRSFAHSPSVKRQGSRVIIAQWGGTDI